MECPNSKIFSAYQRMPLNGDYVPDYIPSYEFTKLNHCGVNNVIHCFGRQPDESLEHTETILVAVRTRNNFQLQGAFDLSLSRKLPNPKDVYYQLSE